MLLDAIGPDTERIPGKNQDNSGSEPDDRGLAAKRSRPSPAMSRRALVRALLISFGFAVLAYLVAFLLPPTYQASQSLYFPSNQQSMVGGALAQLQGRPSESDGAVVPSLKGALPSPLVGSAPDTANGILASRSCMLEVVDKLGLADKWRTTRVRAAKQLQGLVDVRMDKTGFLRIEAQGSSPEEAVSIIKVMQAHLDRRSIELTLNVSRRNRTFIESRLASSNRAVEAMKSTIVQQMTAAEYADPQTLARVYWDTRMRLEEARAKELAAGRQLDAVESTLMAALSPRTDSGNLNAIQLLGQGPNLEATNKMLSSLAVELQNRRLALQDAASRFTKESAEYRQALRNSTAAERYTSGVIQGERAQLLRGKSPQLVAARAQLESLRAAVRANENSFAKFDRSLKQAPLAFASMENLKAQFQQALQTRSMLEGELELARIAEERDPSRFEIVDPAVLEPEPVAPRKALIAGIAFLLAFAVLAGPSLLRSLSYERDAT